MKLPRNEIGISDIIAYRECAQRMSWGMRRHMELPERFAAFAGERDEPPESTNWTNAYGSAVHVALAAVEEDDASDEEAIDAAWAEYGRYLDPEDLELMRADIEKFRVRSQPQGYRVVAVEEDMRVPLFVHEGVQIYFRFKIDALYQHLQNDGLFLSRDYKATKWPRSKKELDEDIQQWAYNFGVHERFPEIEDLAQQVDQLRAGVHTVQKTKAQREMMRDWLIRQVKAILADDALKPSQNQWCPWCPLLMQCSVTHRSTDYWKARLAAVAPERKSGRKTVVDLDPEKFDEYVEMLPRAKDAVKVLERFVNEVQSVLKEMPSDRRRDYGYVTSERNVDTFTPEALREIAEMTGPMFWHLVRLPKSQLESFYGKGKSADPMLDEILRLAEKAPDAVYVRAVTR